VGITHHFKWWGDIAGLLTERAHQFETQGSSWREEPLRLLAHFEGNGGRFNP
jgi:hypothetical protein